MAKAKKAPAKKRPLPPVPPTKFTEARFNAICEILSSTNRGLKSACLDNGICTVTFYKWIKENQNLLNIYARARELQAEILADEIVSIADTPQIGSKTRETKDGVFKETGDMVEHRRLQIDARKWTASKLAPKKYGDKVDVTTGGDKIETTQVFKLGDTIIKF